MNDHHSLIDKGKAYLGANDYDKAEECLKQAVDNIPGDVQAHFELGKVYYVSGKYDLAEDEFDKTVRMDASNVHALSLLGKTCKVRGSYERALEAFKELLTRGYREENIAKEIADIFFLMGQYGSARSYLEKARENGYPDEDYQADLARICHQQVRRVQELNFEGRYKEAFQAGVSAVSIIPVTSTAMRNTILNEQEIAEKKILLESKMRSLTFTLTNRCNLACLMCETRKIPWDLPEKVKKEIVTLLPSLERVMWQGGEAFLYEGFEELLDETSRYPIRQVLATNGMLINERMAEKLVKYNVELTFSIDGVTKDVYEHIRPGAKFEKVLENVALINELRAKHNPSMRTRLNVLIMRANYRQVEEFVEFAHEHRFTTLFFNSTGCDFKNRQENVFYYNREADIITHINAVRDTMAEKARRYGITIENWLPSKDFFGEIAKDDPHGSAMSQSRPQADTIFKNDDRGKLFCHAPWQRLYIDCGGKVRPDCLCPYERDIGNLHESSLMDLWNGSRMAELRKRIIAGSLGGFCNNDCIYGRVPEKNLKYI